MTEIIRADTDRLRSAARLFGRVAQSLSDGSENRASRDKDLRLVWRGDASDRYEDATGRIVVHERSDSEQLMFIARAVAAMAEDFVKVEDELAKAWS
ncbi:WXG100 family type VII secretion target [Lysinibacter cavernae]|uniref:Uncharacterized protein YukE n=1 Tax=Lysinibacter cavernae TaxID=1640652 RepID=A0A7X5R1Y4_9MICO|nr:WXG100 family type VII secretion target [Lysinibacter cavernae]NIH53982.1 uncharacterized protein YukE [Lysinibacter cavernae]